MVMSDKFKKASVSKGVKKYINKRLRKVGELKHAVITVLNTTTSATTAFYQLTPPAVGNTDITRVGDVYKMESLDIGFNFSSADATNVIRVIIFAWGQTDTPTSALVFEDTSVNPVSELTGGLNRDSINSGRMVLIKEFHITLNGVARPNHYFRFKKSLRSLKSVHMSGGSATVGRNTLYMAYISDSSVVTHPAIQFAGVVDFRDV